MHICVDVHYSETHACAAGIIFRDWKDAEPTHEIIHVELAAAEYQPGEFYRRELPSVLALIEKSPTPLSTIIVDGHAWLADSKKGLGAYVHEATKLPVIGVAKRSFHRATPVEVYRGQSKRPLYVSTAGTEKEDAAEKIKYMHGEYRIPTLLKQVDRNCRDAMLNGCD